MHTCELCQQQLQQVCKIMRMCMHCAVNDRLYRLR